MAIRIRELTAADRDLWAALRHELWPETSPRENLDDIAWMLGTGRHWAHLAEIDGQSVGFAEVSLRDYANGCEGRPVPFLEGIWVNPVHRRHGIGAELISHVARLFSAKGFTEMCSDALIENSASHAAHATWGFAETERVVYFRKPL